MNTDLDNQLKDVLNRYQVEDSNKQKQTIHLAEQALASQDFPQTLLKQLVNQIRYLSPSFILIQLLLTLVILIMIGRDYTSSGSVMMYSLAFSVLLCLTMLPELLKSFIYSTWQIEKSCRYAFHQVLLMRYFALGLIEFLLLLTAGSITAFFSDSSFLLTLLRFFVPFTVISGISLGVVTMTNSFLSFWGQQVVTVVLIILLLKGVDGIISLNQLTEIQWILAGLGGSLLSLISMLFLSRKGGVRLGINR
ncbi:hypothetical protein [Enterococcus sp. LJL51]|uniref:hypothetical protein n=1 Tax=Enterococcus sp. LJL51 TaxID=3416656 RepID=UPI003CE72432